MRVRFLLFVILVVVAIGAVVYYFGLYTYFTPTEIHEELPVAVTSAPLAELQTTVSSEPMTSQALQIKTIAEGSFGEIDFVHKGSGQAKLIELDDKTILRLENFSVTSGPDLYVYLSDSLKPTHKIKDLGNYLDLGVLKATSGDQNYDVPPVAAGYRTAVIWCKRFGVLFSFAVME